MLDSRLLKILAIGGWVVAAILIIRPVFFRPLPGNHSYAADRLSQFAVLESMKPGGIVILGDSHIDRGEWSELLSPFNVYNRGIGGDTVEGVSGRLSESIENRPAAVILMVGFNDLAKGFDPPDIANTYEKLIVDIRKSTSKTKIIINSVFPVNKKIFNGDVKNEAISLLNQNLKELAKKYSVVFLDLIPYLIDGNGNLSTKYTNDGIHLNGPGYFVWSQSIVKILNSRGVM